MNEKEIKSVGAGPVSAHTLKTRRNNGITLIALIITIIVMLILVAVTITVAVNGGLFSYAGRAGRETQNAIDKEQELSGGKIQVGDDVIGRANARYESNRGTRLGRVYADAY